MEQLLRFWPVLAFIGSTFVMAVSISVGLTLWIVGKLAEQDAQRITVKEDILREVRERHHTVMGSLSQRTEIIAEKTDQLRSEIGEVDKRLVRVETLILNGGREH